MSLEKPLILLGMMASGKTSVAKEIAEKQEVGLVSIDGLVSQKSGKKIPEIFSSDGEKVFRDLESEALESVLEKKGPMVIDSGGGIVEREENRRLLVASDTDRCYLEVDLPVLLSRITETASRPMLKESEDLEKRIASLLEKRAVLYRETASCIVQVPEGQAIGVTATKVLGALK